MDSRVTELVEDMRSGRISTPDGSLDSDALNERIKALHGQVGDEDSRVELIALHDALMRVSERRLIEQGRDPGPLREEWRRAHLSFLLAESLTDGEVDEAKLARVNAREVAAGRLQPDETVRISRLDPEPAAPPPPAGGGEPSELERAYRAILLWEEEMMIPRLDALVEDFRARLRRLGPGEDRSAAAGRETLELDRWFEANETALASEIVSYLGDDVLQGLKALGVERQFGRIIWDTIAESRADLARRLAEAREAPCGDARADGDS